MSTRLEIGNISVDVVFKDIKNVHLYVYPPTGQVCISAPVRMAVDKIRIFAISKLDWITSQQKKFLEQERETPREYVERESHYVWGKRYLLQVNETEVTPKVELKHNHLVLYVSPYDTEGQRELVIRRWYREQLRQAVSPLIKKWEKELGVEVGRVDIQHMKTKWGSCNPHSRNIRLNLELAKKPPECLEYVVIHEIVHLLAHHHDERFKELLDRCLPNWRQIRESLNELPLGYTDWNKEEAES